MRRVLLIGAIGFLSLGCFALLSSPTPEGYDPDVHGSDGICSSAVFEVIGLGSKDTDSAAGPRGGGPSMGIDDCADPARTQTGLGVVSMAVGVAVLVLRSRVPVAPVLTIGWCAGSG